MATIKTIYTGELRTNAKHLFSGSELITDAPIDNKGKGESFSPTDLVATALGSCMLAIIGICANEHKFSIDGTELITTKIMESNPRRISEIILEFNFPKNNYTDKQKKLIDYSIKNCPVGNSINPNIKQTIICNY